MCARSAAHGVGPTQGIATYRDYLGYAAFSKLADFQQAHRQWMEIALRDELAVRDARWSEAVAVGSLAFVEKIKSELGIKDGRMRCANLVKLAGDKIDSKNEALTPENTLLWGRITEVSTTSRGPTPGTVPTIP